MIWALAAVCILQSLVLGCTLWLLKHVIDQSSEDRKDLTDSLIALTDTSAVQVKRTGGTENGKVVYLDDEAQAALDRQVTDDEE